MRKIKMKYTYKNTLEKMLDEIDSADLTDERYSQIDNIYNDTFLNFIIDMGLLKKFDTCSKNLKPYIFFTKIIKIDKNTILKLEKNIPSKEINNNPYNFYQYINVYGNISSFKYKKVDTYPHIREALSTILMKGYFGCGNIDEQIKEFPKLYKGILSNG